MKFSKKRKLYENVSMFHVKHFLMRETTFFISVKAFIDTRAKFSKIVSCNENLVYIYRNFGIFMPKYFTEQ